MYIKSPKEVTKQWESGCFFLFLLDDRRIRIRIHTSDKWIRIRKAQNMWIRCIRIRNTDLGCSLLHEVCEYPPSGTAAMAAAAWIGGKLPPPAAKMDSPSLSLLVKFQRLLMAELYMAGPDSSQASLEHMDKE
jgi:hypothetical protein